MPGQASLDFTFSSLFVDQIVYILSSGSQEQNLRQIYRLLDDKQVTFTLLVFFWVWFVFSSIISTAKKEGHISVVQLQTVVTDLLRLLDTAYSPGIQVLATNMKMSSLCQRCKDVIVNILRIQVNKQTFYKMGNRSVMVHG